GTEPFGSRRINKKIHDRGIRTLSHLLAQAMSSLFHRHGVLMKFPKTPIHRRRRLHLLRKDYIMRIHPLATLAAAFMFAAAHAATTVPENLRPAPNETLTLETKATGVQIYTCSASKDNATRYEWTFKAPEAELFDPSGARVGKHYAGPTWESIDGSKVV